MLAKKLIQCLLIAATVMAVSLPSQAAMVGTAQLQTNQVALDFGSISAQRDWIKEQLVVGGVDAADGEVGHVWAPCAGWLVGAAGRGPSDGAQVR